MLGLEGSITELDWVDDHNSSPPSEILHFTNNTDTSRAPLHTSIMVNLKSIAIAATCWSANRIDVFRVGFNSDLQRKTPHPTTFSIITYH
jgi:hypothetical protein